MIIGIDTSCYTTSLAMITTEGTVALDRRIVLEVKPGERGLRQSSAIFQHLGNLPKLVETLDSKVHLTAVAAATLPRPASGSYLPVFKVAATFGASIAKIAGVPFIETSHQEGHIRAGLFQVDGWDEQFLAWHISGGTTELLLVNPRVNGGYEIIKIGGTSDLQVGQFIDRVGVALGAPFPAGPYLEKLALTFETKASLPVVTQGLTLSFSGPESAAQRSLNSGGEGPLIASQVFNCIGRSLLEVTFRAVAEYRINKVLFVGGVASNSLIKNLLVKEGAAKGVEFTFAFREYATDNAVGVGLIGYDRWKRGTV